MSGDVSTRQRVSGSRGGKCRKGEMYSRMKTKHIHFFFPLSHLHSLTICICICICTCIYIINVIYIIITQRTVPLLLIPCKFFHVPHIIFLTSSAAVTFGKQLYQYPLLLLRATPSKHSRQIASHHIKLLQTNESRLTFLI